VGTTARLSPPGSIGLLTQTPRERELGRGRRWMSAPRRRFTSDHMIVIRSGRITRHSYEARVARSFLRVAKIHPEVRRYFPEPAGSLRTPGNLCRQSRLFPFARDAVGRLRGCVETRVTHADSFPPALLGLELHNFCEIRDIKTAGPTGIDADIDT